MIMCLYVWLDDRMQFDAIHTSYNNSLCAVYSFWMFGARFPFVVGRCCWCRSCLPIGCCVDDGCIEFIYVCASFRVRLCSVEYAILDTYIVLFTKLTKKDHTHTNTYDNNNKVTEQESRKKRNRGSKHFSSFSSHHSIYTIFSRSLVCLTVQKKTRNISIIFCTKSNKQKEKKHNDDDYDEAHNNSLARGKISQNNSFLESCNSSKVLNVYIVGAIEYTIYILGVEIKNRNFFWVTQTSNLR